MRILLISDIHANLTALDTVLANAGAYDALWCLGDIVGYGPAPNECIERLSPLPLTALAGNHDWAVLGKLEVEDFNDEARRAIEWTRTVLTRENKAWLDKLPDSYRFDDLDMTLVHGSPRAPIWEYVLSSSIAAENMPYFNTGVCLFGHTHVPAHYQQLPGTLRTVADRLAEGRPLALQPKLMLNPGSVGQPRDSDPRAAYAILEPETRTLTYYRVPYDIAKTQAEMVRSGLPTRLVQRLNYGV